MNSLLKFIVPNSVDRWLFALLLLLALAAAATVGQFEFMGRMDGQLFSFAFLTALFCFPAAIGTRSWKDIKSSSPLMLVAIFGTLVVIAASGWSDVWNDVVGGGSSSSGPAKVKTRFLLASWLGMLVCSAGFSRVADQVLFVGTDERKQRLRMLLYVVIVLFACSLAQKFLAYLSRLQPVDRSMGGLLILGILMVVASHLLSRQRHWWSLALVSVFLVICATMLLFGHRNLNLLAGTAAFFVIQWLLWRPFTGQRTAEPKRVWPSFWGQATIALAIGLLVVSSFFDLGVLINTRGAASFGLSRAVRQLKSQLGADANVSSEGMTWNGNNTCGISIQTKFTPEVSPDCFAVFEEVSDSIELHLALENLNPNIDFSHLRGRALVHVDISNSVLSAQQLIDLTHDANNYMHLTDCRIESTEVSPGTPRTGFGALNLVLRGWEANDVAAAVKALQADSFSGALRLSECDLSDEDWRAIVGLKGTAGITISDCTLPSSAETATIVRTALQQPDAPTITGYANSRRKYWRFVAINVDVSGHDLFDTDVEIWDALFTGHWRLSLAEGYWDRWMGQPNLVEKLKEFHLAFESGHGLGVMIPFLNDKAIEIAGTMPGLEVLSFEPLWISSLNPNRFAPNHQPINFTPLKKLNQLRELYLPSGILLDDFQFFAGLPNLETLQFDAFHDAGLYRMPNVKAEWFPKLKKIMLFSEPHPKLLQELAKLEQLEVIELLDGSQWFELPEDCESFRSIFNEDVEIRFFDIKDYPNPPESYQQHLKQVRELIRQRRWPNGLDADAETQEKE